MRHNAEILRKIWSWKCPDIILVYENDAARRLQRTIQQTDQQMSAITFDSHFLGRWNMQFIDLKQVFAIDLNGNSIERDGDATGHRYGIWCVLLFAGSRIQAPYLN